MNKVWIVIPLLLALTGCGGSSSSNKGTKIDTSEYFPKSTITKEYTQVIKSVDKSSRDVSEFVEDISVEPNMITIQVDGETTAITTIHKDKVTIQEFGDIERVVTMKREVYTGDKVIEDIQENITENLKVGSQIVGNRSIQTEESCLLESTIDEFTQYIYDYKNYDNKHDIIKLKCTIRKTEITSVEPDYVDKVIYENGTVEFKPNISYRYLQKEIGIISIVNNDCIVEKTPEIVVDDTAKPNECIGEQYNHVLWHNDYPTTE